jgi:hypothetical protein
VTLRWTQRIERRIFIRRAITCAKEKQLAYNEQLKHWDGPGRQPDEDWWAVVAHLDEDRDMFAGLRKPKSG